MLSKASPVLRPSRKGKFQVKPYPDPNRTLHDVNSSPPPSPSSSSLSAAPPPSPWGRRQQQQRSEPRQQPQYLTPEKLKEVTEAPSRNWIQAGSKHIATGTTTTASSISTPSTARFYLEILSAHNLPNVDMGSSVGNVTDAFVTALYGDAMVQTDIIDDELSPHWPCWSQRSFVFYMHDDEPTQVLYIGVFGYKRNTMLHHVPIGRVEVNPINFRTNTIYDLHYELKNLSHTSNANTTNAAGMKKPTLRFRMKLEIPNERHKLLSTLLHPLPSQPVYINVMKKKSLFVARYTACGEYDDQVKFNLNVLQGYIDELLEGYIRRILYSIQDAIKSVVFWRGENQFQMKRPVGCGSGRNTKNGDNGGETVEDGNDDDESCFSFPLYSLIAFIFGMLLVEYPTQLFPSIVCFSGAIFLLNQMQQRINSPSPWRRCHSFNHYLQILVFGKSASPSTSCKPMALCHKPTTEIEPYEGYKKLQQEHQKLVDRIQHDKEFIEKKDAVEKEIEEIEKEEKSIQTKTESLIPVELLDVLGKVQGIVGGKFQKRIR